jgi:hypothetical protein
MIPQQKPNKQPHENLTHHRRRRHHRDHDLHTHPFSHHRDITYKEPTPTETMKLTLEPTQPPSSYGLFATHPKVTVEYEADDLNLSEVYSELVNPALVAMGFLQKSIDSFWEEGCLCSQNEEPEVDPKKLELANKLERYNKWRRGDDSINFFDGCDTYEIGNWIDEAIAYLRGGKHP